MCIVHISMPFEYLLHLNEIQVSVSLFRGGTLDIFQIKNK